MLPHILGIDHVLIRAGEAMDAAADAWARLGFRLTPRGHHSSGSINHLIMLGPDYLELIGVPEGGAARRPELAQQPPGLHGIAFAADSASGAHAALANAGFAPPPVEALSRPVNTAEGPREARFNLVRLPADTVPWGRLLVCEHLTRELVWRDGLRSHPNGAREITRITVVVPNPGEAAQRVATLFAEVSTRSDEGRAELVLGHVRLELITARTLQHRLGEFAPEAGGRSAYMAALELRCTDLAATRAALRAMPPGEVNDQGSRLTVAARRAGNTTLEFID